MARFFPADGNYRCSVPNCPQGQEGAGCKTTFNLCYHFAYRHPVGKVLVSGVCLPKCPSCGLQVTRTAGTPEHLASKTCRKLMA